MMIARAANGESRFNAENYERLWPGETLLYASRVPRLSRSPRATGGGAVRASSSGEAVRAAVTVFLCLSACSCGITPVAFPTIPLETSVPDMWYGVATSPYQVEDPFYSPGDDGFFKTDWDLFYEAGRLDAAKGRGTWSYTEVQRDIDALKWLGVTHYRFGIEWARVEPRPGEVNTDAVRHYADLARDLQSAGITPIVCLWHFSFPSWLADLEDASRHGWLHPLAQERWAAYVRLMFESLAPYVAVYAPQNEPEIQSMAAFGLGLFPPSLGHSEELQQRNRLAAAEAFIRAVDVIREVYPQNAGDQPPPVKILSIQAFNHWEGDVLDIFGTAARAAESLSTQNLDRVVGHVDIIGFTYYGRVNLSLLGVLTHGLRRGPNFSDIGVETYPEGLTLLIARLAERYGKPLLITENGISDTTDEKRPGYLVSHIDAVRQAIDQGYDILGYFHWSLVDNYEWQDGYTQQFGLFSMNPETRALVPNTSAHIYRDLLEARGDLYHWPG